LIQALNHLEVVTLFVSDIQASKTFYTDVFGQTVVYEDAVSAVMQFGGVMINLLASTEAPKLVEPRTIARVGAGPSALLTIKVNDVDAVCEELRAHGVAVLNGPINRPWGRRTAAFEDPAGNVWEVAQEI
jgi:catechol 2,3-dioxygenase-like lactoylglutathione lyase family enzyme